jgi:hypothetical protein
VKEPRIHGSKINCSLSQQERLDGQVIDDTPIATVGAEAITYGVLTNYLEELAMSSVRQLEQATHLPVTTVKS